MRNIVIILVLLGVLLCPVEALSREIQHLDTLSHCLAKINETVNTNEGYKFVYVVCYDQEGKAYPVNISPISFKIPQNSKLVKIEIGVINFARWGEGKDSPLMIHAFQMAPP